MPSRDIDVVAARAATPGCDNVVHFNNAGSALPTSSVLTTQIDHLNLEALTGGYEAHDQQQARIDAIRPTIARLLGADPSGDEIALTVNSTAGFDLFLYSFAYAAEGGLNPGDRILTTETEYGANFVAYLQIAKRTGAVVEVVPSNDWGEIDLPALEATIRRGDVGPARLISINHIPTNGGLVNPAVEVGRIAREYGITYLLDACQSAGQRHLDVEEIGCDALTATGRKFVRGPRGTGFLYVRKSVLTQLEPIMLDHDAAAWVAPDRYEVVATAGRFEQWERSYAALLGLGQAVTEALDHGLDAIERRITYLADGLRARLNEFGPTTVHDLGRDRCGIVTFTVAGHAAAAVKSSMQKRGINMSTTEAGSVLIDATKRNLAPMVRASLHIYNTDDELDLLMTELQQEVNR